MEIPTLPRADSRDAPLITGKARHELMMLGTAQCTQCRTVKFFSFFVKRASSKWGIQTTCLLCHAANVSAATRLKVSGFTQNEYDDQLAKQGGVCAICGGVNESGAALSADHCHATGAKRGLLCSNCNRALGLFGDSADRLRAAANYIDPAPLCDGEAVCDFATVRSYGPSYRPVYLQAERPDGTVESVRYIYDWRSGVTTYKPAPGGEDDGSS